MFSSGHVIQGQLVMLTETVASMVASMVATPIM